MLGSDLAQRGPVHFLEVRLVGTRSYRDGIGSLVTIRAAGRAQLQVNDGKSGCLAPDSISVKWPTGKQEVVLVPLRSGATVVVREQ